MSYSPKLVRARNLVRTLLRQGQLFTFLSPALLAASGLETLPSTNNRLEGGINAQIRRMWGWHRGMPFLHRVKAAYWWCYTHSPSPLPAARILGEMPTDATIVLSVRLICLCGDFEFAGCVVQLLILLFPACHGVGAPPLGG